MASQISGSNFLTSSVSLNSQSKSSSVPTSLKIRLYSNFTFFDDFETLKHSDKNSFYGTNRLNGRNFFLPFLLNFEILFKTPTVKGLSHLGQIPLFFSVSSGKHEKSHTR